MAERILKNIEPVVVLEYFEDLSRIPRESGKEEQIVAYLMEFARKHGLEASQDEALNVLIRKPGSPGYENHKTVILQSHIDMVCEKNADTEHDFSKDPLKLVLNGDILSAEGTTLGADDGVGVAFTLALLADPKAEHPPLEALFTSDEERGMTGVEAFDASKLTGRTLINLDSGEEGAFIVGCAGGPMLETVFPLKREKAPEKMVARLLAVRGLKGGHSGEDIHRGRANSIKLMARTLGALVDSMPVRLEQIEAGLKYNAIPREATAVILIPEQEADRAQAIAKTMEETFLREYRIGDPQITVSLSDAEAKEDPVTEESFLNLLDYICLAETGIIRMDAELKDTVESSVSMGTLRTEKENFRIQALTRSSLKSQFREMERKIRRLAARVGASVELVSDCPEWEYQPDSRIKSLFTETFRQMYGKEAEFQVLHAGLECGVFSRKIDEPMDMIAMGPDMWDLHTPGESLNLSSTARVWDFFLEVMRKL